MRTLIAIRPVMRTLFYSLVTTLLLTGCGDSGTPPDESGLEQKAARIHEAALTVDTHTDTPLRVGGSGFDFGERNDPVMTHSKIDLPRMKEGGMDGIWFAAFVGQGERTTRGNAEALARAREIIEGIHTLVEQYPGDLEIATKANDLKRIVKDGKHAIYIGVENGYPLGNNVDLLETFYNKGVRYVTLVHSDNNDICDSSTDTLEHGGLSPFGEQVVERMNDLGIIVDISHASDDSFYDVIEKSRAPVIASHSCSRAMCDNPRNLSDDMLLKLKENGGVIQLCILSGYIKSTERNPQRDSAMSELRSRFGRFSSLDQQDQQAYMAEEMIIEEKFPRELATVKDAVDHIDHIVELIGIDHVGIGTDFDGGGGLADCYDVSQMGNITLELVRRGYTEREIKKIWGGNFLRVFKAVEKAAV